MSVRTFELRAKKLQYAIPHNDDSHSPAAKVEHIHIMIFDALTNREACGAERSTCNRDGKLSVVIICVIHAVAKVDDVVAFIPQQFCQFLLHFEFATIFPWSDFQGWLSSALRLALRNLLLCHGYNLFLAETKLSSLAA
jgi:hypothetical protein